MRPRSRTTPRALAAALSLLLLGCAVPPAPSTPAAAPELPETATGFRARPAVAATRQMVVAAHPLAAEAGLAMLRSGGNAVDAAVAVQMMLALVEPQSSGIGGGAFLLHWDGRTARAWDGRETAPMAADERMLLGSDGQPLPRRQAIVGGLSVGVPGVVRLLEDVHRAQGRLPWARLFEPAIAQARAGFALTPRLHAQLAGDSALRDDPLARALYYRADGTPHPVGHRLRNPALAAILERIAAQGSDALHAGPVAADLVARVRAHPTRPGRLTVDDLARYRALSRVPICTAWLARYRVCGMPPPSAGHVVLIQVLGMLSLHADHPARSAAGTDAVPGPDWLHTFTQAARLAQADRDVYLADPAFVDPPAGRWTSLLDERYLRERAALIGPRSLGVAPAGRPRGEPIAWAAQPAQAEEGTSHVSIVDADGGAVALTSSIESAFGARLMSDGGTGLAGGFLLNNQLTDFSFEPADGAGRRIANRVQPGKRPRSSMAPTMVFDAADGRLLLVAGSPLGPVIPQLVARTLIGALQWQWPLDRVLAAPNLASVDGPTLLEAGRYTPATIEALQARGHGVVESPLPSGIHAIVRGPRGWIGAADPRREGVALGD